MVPALQSGCYDITWERCADLPSPMYAISAVQHDKKVYIMAGEAPDNDKLYQVYCYNVETDQWGQLPPPGHCKGRVQIIDSKLTVIGGWDNVTNKASKKVSTYINNIWTDHFPNLLRARGKPGVVSHSDYVIVAGGMRDEDTINDDIEVLNTTQSSQWMMTSVLLPQPMWAIYPTISDYSILIVGYTSDLTYSTAYQLPVDVIISSTTQQATSDHPVQWMKLPSAPHHNTRTIPNSHPPVIMGGRDLQCIPTSDVAILDDKKWIEVASLSSPRFNNAVVPITSDTILVLGGCTGGVGVAGAEAHSITTVEKGRATLTQTAAAIPTEDTQCSIQ